MNNTTKLSPPWITFYKELSALFEKDPAVKLEFDEDEYKINIYVDGPAKADALSELLPLQKTFGNVTVHICVIPANIEKEDMFTLFKIAFEGNGAFSYAKKVEGIYAPNLSYVVFKNEVVQFFNDDLGDINGVKSTLYQEIAKDVFEEHEGIYFCTDVVE